MTMIVSNPGAAWFPEMGTYDPEQALRNVEAFVAELTDVKAEIHPPLIGDETFDALRMGGTKYQPMHDGRYPFLLVIDGKRHLIEMPGLPIEQVRYHDEDDTSIVDFPRLYTDGSSWIWFIAVDRFNDPELEEWAG